MNETFCIKQNESYCTMTKNKIILYIILYGKREFLLLQN